MKYITIFFIAYTNLSYALGVGDITLKSHLGEPLSATIMVTGVENSTDTDCFAVTDVSDTPAFRRAAISLSPINGNYQLNISTPEVITEPIVNLRASFVCEPLFQRDYVLLLDPAPLTTKRSLNTTNLTNSDALALQSQANNQDSRLQLEATAPAPTKKPIKKNKRQKAENTNAITDKALVAAYTGKQDAPAGDVALDGSENTRQTPVADNASKPYLSISGGNKLLSDNSSQPNLSLRLETKIDFSRMETAPLTQQDAMDEITVMANRLAYLEKQIINLQTKNAQLLTETESAKNAGFQLSQWLHYLLVIGIIFILLAAAEWIRRKLMRSRLVREQAFWFADKNISRSTEPDVSTNASNNTTDSIFDDLSFSQKTGGPYSAFTGTDAFTIDSNDVNENILENAEVFIEHGRTALAIQLLQNHLTDYPTESPKVWSKLLGLIASEDSEVEYDSTATDFKRFFNIKIPSFQDANIQDRSSIEDYPHIIARLEGVWGSHYAVELLNELVYNNQSDPRDGFERGAFEDLFFLKQIAETLETHASKEQGDLQQPDIVKPAITNLTFQEAAVSNASNLDEEKITQDIGFDSKELIPDEQAMQMAFAGNDHDIDNAYSFDATTNEVGLIANFGKVDSTEEVSAPTITLNTEPESLTEDDFSESELANEIDFLIATGNKIEADSAEENIKDDSALLKDKPETKTSAIFNEIEWDLPKLDQP